VLFRKQFLRDCPQKGIIFFVFAFSLSPLGGAELFRTTPTVGAVGDGMLTAQISYEGTVICLRYPNATFYEHIRYVPGYWDPDPEKNAWLKPHFGARENEGIFAGVSVEIGGVRRVYWLRDLSRTFSYASERSNRLVGIYRSEDGLEVAEVSFVVPSVSALIRGYTIRSLPALARDPELLVIANPALSLDRPAYNPLNQTEDDDRPRFASFYLESQGGILTALPKHLDPDERRQVYELLRSSTPSAVEGYVVGRAERWGEGVYLLQGGAVPPRGFQVGRDRWLSSFGPEDAYEDAKDGILSSSPLSVSWETTALAIPFVGEEAVYYAVFAQRVTEAIATLSTLRGKPLKSWEEESDRFFYRWTEGMILPQGERGRAFALRTAISLRTGYDPGSGAIVASTSCSPPYNLDWPRDGAFFQLFLIMNQKLEEAKKHALFYPRMQYQNRWGLYGPPGSFPMNAYADGTPGGPVDFEIDEIGFVLWIYEMTAQALASRDLAEAKEFLDAIRTSAYLASELLLSCRDEKTGLQCPANEDDNPAFTQTFHGAITVWLGLKSSARIFSALGEDLLAQRYERRAQELAEAIRRYLNPIRPVSVREDNLDLQAYAWGVWPAYFFLPEEKEILDHLRSAFTAQLEYVFGPRGRDTIYDTKPGIALLIPPLRTEETVAFMREIARIYLDEVVTPGTLHLAEVATRYDLDGDGKLEWVNRVAPPHLWAQVLLYFTLLGLENPEALRPPSLDPTPFRSSSPAQGCTCGVSPAPDPWGGMLVVLLVALLYPLLRRYPRRQGLRSGGSKERIHL